MTETRRLCRKCYKRRKLDATGRCRQCSPPNAVLSTRVARTDLAVIPNVTIPPSASSVAIVAPPRRRTAVTSSNQAKLHERSDGGMENGRLSSDKASSKAAADDHSIALTARLGSHAIDQMQMFSDFFQSHMPRAGAAEVNRARAISYLVNIPFMNTTSPLLSAAVDALCYAHFASTRHDPRLLHASQSRYGHVLNSIRRMLTPSGAPALSSREIVVAIMIISLFDECMPVEQRDANSSMTHLWGAQQYLTATPPSQFDLNHPLDRSLVLNVFQNGFWLAVAKRQQVSVDRWKWDAVADGITPARTPYSLLAQVPSLLETTDRLLNQKEVDFAQLTSLCEDLETVRHDILSKTQNHSSVPHPSLVRNTDVAKFDSEIEEHRFIMASNVFPSQYRFVSPESAVNSACQAVIFLVIDCTLLRIYHFRPAARDFRLRRTPAEVELNAVERATQLCQCVLHFSQLSSMAYLDFLILFLELVLNFYQEQGSQSEEQWCQECLAATKTRLERLRVIRPPTLCRLGDLPMGIKAAGRYRSPQLSVSEHRTADTRTMYCPVARFSKGKCPVTNANQPPISFHPTPSSTGSPTSALSLSPAMSMATTNIREIDADSNDGWASQ